MLARLSTAVATAPLPPDTTLVHVPVLAADPSSPKPGDTWVNSTIDEWRVCIKADEGAPPVIAGSPLSRSALISQQYKLSQYIDLLLNFALAFAAGFQMPVVVLLLGWVGIVTPQFLAKYRRHAILACAILGAALTPGDPLSATMLAVPLYILFELGLFLLKKFPVSKVAGRKPALVEQPPPAA